MTPFEKAKATIIANYKKPGMTDDEAWEAYKAQRYLHPSKAEERRQRASKAGKATKKRTFNDPKKASEAGKKRWENVQGN